MSGSSQGPPDGSHLDQRDIIELFLADRIETDINRFTGVTPEAVFDGHPSHLQTRRWPKRIGGMTVRSVGLELYEEILYIMGLAVRRSGDRISEPVAHAERRGLFVDGGGECDHRISSDFGSVARG